jgi:glycosyltransferase involved in cell wall biosynthesis
MEPDKGLKAAVLEDELLSSADIAYLTKYTGKLDSGIAFTDVLYLRSLASLPLKTLVYANRLPEAFPADGLQYTTELREYRRHDYALQLVNGMGSAHDLLREGFFPEHHACQKIAFIHDEPSAYDLYNTKVWNLPYVKDRLMSRFDGFIFVSHNCMQQWRDTGALGSKLCFTLPNTCAEETYLSETLLTRPKIDVREELELGDGRLHLAIVATVQPRKAQLDAVRSLLHLPNHVVLHLVGKVTQPAYGNEVIAFIEAHGLEDRVLLHGQQPKERALKFIRGCDALLLPSRSEAMPMVILEAMQLGTPVFATRVGGVPELLTDTTGVMFEPGDEQDLALKLRPYVLDPSLLTSLASAARERYWSHFSNQRFAENFLAIAQRLLDSQFKAPRVNVVDDQPVVMRKDGFELVVAASGDEQAVVSSDSRVPSYDVSLRGDLSVMAEVPWVRETLAQVRFLGPIARASLQHEKPTLPLEEALRAAHPFAQLGLDVTHLSLERGAIECRAATAAEPALATRTDVFNLIDRAAFFQGATRDHARRVGNPRAARELAKLQQTYRWRVSNAVAGPFMRSPQFKKARGLTRKIRKLFKQGLQAFAEPAPKPSAVVVLNSPMQLMAFLSLWETKYRAQTPNLELVAMIYSTNGSAEFGAHLCGLAQRTRAFAKVVDITPLYESIYASSVTFGMCKDIKRAVMRELGEHSPEVVFFAAFMSARGQKMLYEAFAGSTIRLFEDGLGSYVPKRIKMLDEGIVDRVSSGDCAEAHHIRLISSVDLMLRRVPCPPQYHTPNLTRVSFPVVTRGEYRIDYGRCTRLMNAPPPTRFTERDVLLVTQNFCDHLGKRGFTATEETAIYDSVIETLLTKGYRVTIRPHPRASTQLWNPTWAGHPDVVEWTSAREFPLELLLDYTALPAALVGISSSCLFYLSAPPYKATCLTLETSRVEGLIRKATDEHQHMLQIASGVLKTLESLPSVRATMTS